MNHDLRNDDRKRTVVMVDDNIANIAAGKAVLKEQFEVFTVPSAKKFFALMQIVKPDLILLDIEMPETNGYEILRHLVAENKDFDIPVIFLTARTDPGSELEGLLLGATDYISKPFSPPLLIKRIENSILIAEQRRELLRRNESLDSVVQSQLNHLIQLQSSILTVIAELVEFRDDVTGDHVMRTSRFLEILLNAMNEQGIYETETASWENELFLQSALLHDVGKIGISDAILNKPDRLTPEEYTEIKRHVEIGERIIESIRQIHEESIDYSFLFYAHIFVSYHHEKWDGSGYPRGLAGEEIPLPGRLMAIVDVYDALISKRPYKNPLSLEDAQKIIADGSGTSFDPQLVELFLSVKDQISAATALSTVQPLAQNAG